MSTSTLNHRALLPAVVAGIALAVTPVVTAGAAFASTPAAVTPGNNGDVKIHRTPTDPADPRNQPKACGFYIGAFNFDPSQTVTYEIVAGPGFKGAPVLEGTFPINTEGEGRSADLTLANGQYKLNFSIVGEKGSTKQKVFKLACTGTGTATPTPTPPAEATPTPTPTPIATEATPTPTPVPAGVDGATPTPVPAGVDGTTPVPAPASGVGGVSLPPTSSGPTAVGGSSPDSGPAAVGGVRTGGGGTASTSDGPAALAIPLLAGVGVAAIVIVRRRLRGTG